MDENSEVLQQFLAFTGSDEGVALTVLESTNWVLEDAVNLFFATGGEGLGGGGGGGGGSGGAAQAGGSGGGAGGPMPGDVGAAAGAAGGGVVGPGDYEDEVRAPDVAKMERLYGDHHMGVPPSMMGHYGMGGMGPLAGMGGRSAGAAGGAQGPGGAEPGYVDAFRDFEAEARRAAGTAGAGGGGSDAGGASGSTPAGGGGGLSDLFKPPEKILFKGPLEGAKQAALQQGRWLLVNIQSSSEFSSHRLNRDTWSEGLVQEMISGMFVFWQAYDNNPQGQMAVSAYHLNTLPAILIIDPITGSQVWQRTGFVSAEALIEELVPFMDAGPNDPAASALAQQAAASLASKHKAAAAAALAVPRSEDEELALALAMSVEEAGGSGGAGGGCAGEAQGVAIASIDEAEVLARVEEMQRREDRERQQRALEEARGQQQQGRQQQRQPPAAAVAVAAAAAAPAAAVATPPAAAQDPARAQAEAASRVPQEPAAGDPSALRVAVRLPEGHRAQRRFLPGDTVVALNDWVASLSPEAAVRPFALGETGPGAPVLSDPSATLGASGVAGAMLVVRWTD